MGMNTREIRASIDTELYNELYLAMMEHREYDGCYVMQYSEQQDNGRMVAVFLMRESLTQESD